MSSSLSTPAASASSWPKEEYLFKCQIRPCRNGSQHPSPLPPPPSPVGYQVLRPQRASRRRSRQIPRHNGRATGLDRDSVRCRNVLALEPVSIYGYKENDRAPRIYSVIQSPLTLDLSVPLIQTDPLRHCRRLRASTISTLRLIPHVRTPRLCVYCLCFVAVVAESPHSFSNGPLPSHIALVEGVVYRRGCLGKPKAV